MLKKKKEKEAACQGISTELLWKHFTACGCHKIKYLTNTSLKYKKLLIVMCLFLHTFEGNNGMIWF